MRVQVLAAKKVRTAHICDCVCIYLTRCLPLCAAKRVKPSPLAEAVESTAQVTAQAGDAMEVDVPEPVLVRPQMQNQQASTHTQPPNKDDTAMRVSTSPVNSDQPDKNTISPLLISPSRAVSAPVAASAQTSKQASATPPARAASADTNTSTASTPSKQQQQQQTAEHKQRVMLNLALEEILLVTYRRECANNDANMLLLQSGQTQTQAQSQVYLSVGNVSECVCSRLTESGSAHAQARTHTNKGAMSYLISCLKRSAAKEQLATDEKMRDDLQK
jgi:hypothetical protein